MSNGNNMSNVTDKLHEAIINEKFFDICGLLTSGADPNAVIECSYGEIKRSNGEIETGNAPLHMMTEKCVLWAVLILISWDAEKDKKNDAGNTPLHIAARRGWESIFWNLVVHGADLNITNNKGQTPADVARKYGNTQPILG